MASREVRRAHGRVIFGEGDKRRSVPDPTTEQHSDGRHRARYTDPPNYSAADQAETYCYLVAVCPTTALAVEKLRAIRRALATVEPEEKDDPQ